MNNLEGEMEYNILPAIVGLTQVCPNKVKSLVNMTTFHSHKLWPITENLVNATI